MSAPVIPALHRPSFASKPKPEVVLGPPRSWMLYGDTGTQKTLTLGKVFEAGFYKRVLFIDLDNGIEVLASNKTVLDAIENDVIDHQVIDTFDYSNATMELEAMILEVAGKWRDPVSGKILTNPNIPDFGYDLVFIDTVNMMHETALKHFQAICVTDKGKPDGLAAYARVAVWMDEMLRIIHNSNRFVGGFVMHAKTVEEKTGATKIKPKLSGSFQNSIATIPSIVAYLDYQQNPATKEVVLAGTVGESEIYESKNRYDLPAIIYGFSLSDVLTGIYEQVGLPIPTPLSAINPATPAAAAA